MRASLQESAAVARLSASSRAEGNAAVRHRRDDCRRDRAISGALRAIPDVEAVSPVLGGQLHVAASATANGRPRRRSAAIAAVQGDYEITDGREPRGAERARGERRFSARERRCASATRFRPPRATIRSFARSPDAGRSRVVGRAHFLYMAAEQRAVALPLATLQAMQGAAARDRVSLFMVRARQGANVDAVLHRIERAVPRVSAISTERRCEQVDERLSYFRQLAFILGAVSLGVGFLLVTTLVTVSVNERLGEIVVMRAIGVARARDRRSRSCSRARRSCLPARSSGLGLGLRHRAVPQLDSRVVPGASGGDRLLPVRAARRVDGARHARRARAFSPAIYPSWRGASLPIATTLREEAVG